MEIRYGSDQRGLICGFRFESGATGVPIDFDTAVRWLRDGEADSTCGSNGFVWLHLNLVDAGVAQRIEGELPVAPEFLEALQTGSVSTRIEDAQDSLVAVLNDVAYEFSFDPTQIATLWAHVGPRLVVTARRHALRSIDRLREEVRAGTRFDTSLAFLNRLLRDQADVLVRIVREATGKVDPIEDRMLAGHLLRERGKLGQIRRVLVRLQRLLAPEPGALFRLLRQPPPWCSQDDLEELRQSTEEFSLVIRDMAALQERIKLVQEELGAQVAEQTNRSVHTLTMVTVLALPINIVAGLLGMNVGGVPLAQHEHGFLVVVVLIAIFTVIAAWLAFRRRD